MQNIHQGYIGSLFSNIYYFYIKFRGYELFDNVAIVLSLLSFGVALFALKVSIKRYDLQSEQHELQKKEYEDKKRAQLHIVDEQFLTSHTLNPKEAGYYTENPDEIEFEYKASYVNRSNVIIDIKSIRLLVKAVDVEKMSFGCGENILLNKYLIKNEEINIEHRFNKENLSRFKKYISEVTNKRGVLQFEIECLFSALNGSSMEHKRILYRMAENGGDVSCQGYNPGGGIEKHSFIY